MSAQSNADDPRSLSLRDLLLRSGVEVLDRDGLGLSARSLSYARVFGHLKENYGVTIARASVHERIWPSHRDFRRDVVAKTIGYHSTNMFGPAVEQLRATMLDLLTRDLPTSDRISVFSRHFGPIAHDAMTASPSFRDVQVAKAMASPFNDPLATKVLYGPLADRVATVQANLCVRFENITNGLGVRPLADVVVERSSAFRISCQAMANAIIGSYLDRNAGLEELTREVDVVDPLVGRGELPWTPLGIGYHALLLSLFGTSGNPEPALPDPPPDDPDQRLEIQPGSGSRRAREQLRDLVLSAAVELLLQDRIDLAPETLRYSSVFSYIEEQYGIKVYRSTVHPRLWSRRDDYVLDVLIHGISTADPVGVRPELPPFGATPRDVQAARAMARERIRVLVHALGDECLQSSEYLRRQAIKASLLSQSDSALVTSLRRALRESEAARLQHLTAVLQEEVVAIGFEPRPELGMGEDEALRVLAALTLTTVSGAVFDQSAGVEATAGRFQLRRADDQALADEWTAPAVLTWATFERLFRSVRSERR